MHFNGLNSYAEVPSSVQLNPQQISIVALVKFTGFYAGNCQTNNIIYKSVSYYTPGCWAMLVDDLNYDHDCNVYSPGFEQLGFAASTPVAVTAPAGNYVAQNKWYLLVATYDGDTAKCYQISMDDASQTATIAPIWALKYGIALGSNNQNVFIGKTQNTTYPYYLNGDLDELALFNKALTVAEIKSVYDYLWAAGLSVHANSMLSEATTSMMNGTLQVRNPAPGTLLNVAVYDMSGKRLTGTASRNASANVDLSNCAAGMLMVRLESKGETVTKKVSNL